MEPGEPYLPRALDDYHCFPLDPQLEQGRDLMGFEVTPGVKQEVHHVLLFAAPRQAPLDRDAREPGAASDAVWTPLSSRAAPRES